MPGLRASELNVMRRRGFTIAEGLIATVVLAVAVVGIAGLIAASSQQAAAMEQSAQGLTLARQLLEEIIARPFQDPQDPTNTAIGRDFGETDRVDFDDVDDYHGWSDQATALPTPAGTVDASGGRPFTRGVVVERVVPNGVAAAATDFALVKVIVSTPAGQSLTLSQLVTRTESLEDLAVWN